MAQLFLNLFLSSFSRCCECSASLSHWYYEKDGQLFCRKDYWAKFGELCHGCNDPITTGLIMVTASIRWLSSLIISLVLCWLTNFKLQLKAVSKHMHARWQPHSPDMSNHPGWCAPPYEFTPMPLVALSDCFKDHQWKLELLCWHLRPERFMFRIECVHSTGKQVNNRLCQCWYVLLHYRKDKITTSKESGGYLLINTHSKLEESH